METKNKDYYENHISFSDLTSKYEINLKKCVTQIMYGIRHLHDELNFAHGGISTGNILFTSNFNWKISGSIRVSEPRPSKLSDMLDLGELIFKIAYTFPDNESYFKQMIDLMSKRKFPNDLCLNVFHNWKSAVVEMVNVTHWSSFYLLNYALEYEISSNEIKKYMTETPGSSILDEFEDEHRPIITTVANIIRKYELADPYPA